MSDTIEIEEEGLLDTSRVKRDPEAHDEVIADDEKVFIPAAGVSAESLMQALRQKHTEDKYPGFSIIFRVVKNRVMVIIDEKTLPAQVS